MTTDANDTPTRRQALYATSLNASKNSLHLQLSLELDVIPEKQHRHPPSYDFIHDRFWASGAPYVRGPQSTFGQEYVNTQARKQLNEEHLEAAAEKELDLAAAARGDLLYGLHKAAVQTKMALATPGELPVTPDAPSRCPKPNASGSRLIEYENEVQLASRRLFQPNCDPRYRRVMVEMTPGIGKTCIYIGVIADFLGKICKENNKAFDIIVLADNDSFGRFQEDLRRCPAKASIVRYETKADGRTEKIPVLTYGTANHSRPLPEGDEIKLRDVNPDGNTGFCTVAAHISDGKTPHETFEFYQNERQCGEDRHVWAESRVIFMHYSIAARWILLSGQGVPASEAVKNFVFDSKQQEEDFLRDAKNLTWKAVADKAKKLAPSSLVQGETTMTSKYKLKTRELLINEPNLVFIVDECQNLGTPSGAGWQHDKRGAQEQGVFLSEVLWRLTGDPRTSPYLFAGTGTPNLGPALTPSICLLQMINGRGKPSSFLPFVVDENRRKVPVKTVAEYRKLLVQRDPAPRFIWRSLAERTAEYLVVHPRHFLEADAGFVRDMSSDDKEAFPLYLPKIDSSSYVVLDWQVSHDYTYAQATREVLKCLPAPPKTKLAAADAEVAHANFICAAKPTDLAAEATRIFKPIYNDANRQFLQDLVADRVFIANSYYDYHYYPQIDELPGSGGPPMTRIVVPQDVLVCLPPGHRLPSKLPPRAPPKAHSRSDHPRLLQETAYFSAQVVEAPGDVKQQYPWRIPPRAADTYIKKLQRDTSDGLDWAERSFWAGDVADLQRLAEDLVTAYWANPDVASLVLENRLRDLVAENSPKLVTAADDMFPCAHVKYRGPPIEGKSFFFLNVQNHRDDDFKGLDDNYYLIVASFYFRMRCRPYLQRLHPEVDPAKAQHRIGWLDALRHRGGSELPPDFRKNEANAYWGEWREAYRKVRTVAAGAKTAVLMPAFFVIADNKLREKAKAKKRGADVGSDAVHHRFKQYLSGGSGDHLSFEDILQLMGLPSLRDAMVAAINEEPCLNRTREKDVRTLSPAAQSGLVAGDAAHKAVDLKCVGFNLSFGPMPRGKRIQEMGRNWRSCSFQQLDHKQTTWRISLRQLFLAPAADETDLAVRKLLRRDLLIDSFYEAQNEALQWLRMITVSAGIGCSHWWEYSQWAKQFETYRSRNKADVAWFDADARSPCLDASEAAAQDKSEPLFYRCSKTARGSAKGSVVASRVGAYFHGTIVGVSGDASCPKGTAELHCNDYAERSALPRGNSPVYPHVFQQFLQRAQIANRR
jgi:hypothetical protein